MIQALPDGTLPGCTFCGNKKVVMIYCDVLYCKECKIANSGNDAHLNVQLNGMAKRICELECQVADLKNSSTV